MKKKIFVALLIGIVGLLVGYNVYQSQKKKVHLSALAMANVEALARGELPEVVITCGAKGGQWVTNVTLLGASVMIIADSQVICMIRVIRHVIKFING